MDDQQLVADVRAFNRFYTRLIGVLDAGMHQTAFTLAEARVIYEIGTHGSISHGELARALQLDPGYLTRLNFKLGDAGVVVNTRGASDRRSVSYALTADGDAVFAQLNAASDAAVAALLSPLPSAERARLADAMRSIRVLLGDTAEPGAVVLRPHRIGELGWLIHRQGLLYNEQYGWNGDFEALIARIYNEYHFASETPPKSLWVAEQNGSIAGSIFCMPSESLSGSAQLRMLYVEPAARGRGIGRALVEHCVAFARGAGYERMRLWTHSTQTAARRLYAAAGFEIAEEWDHESFGKQLHAEIWELRF